MPASYRSAGCIGYIAPPRCNETVIEEALAIRPPGLSWCFASLGMPEFGERDFTTALALVEESVRQLVERRVSVVVYSGVPLTAQQGEDYHSGLESRLQELAGPDVPVVTDTSLVLRALAALEVRRLTVITPYQEPTVRRLKALMESKGHQVVDATGLGLRLGQLLTDVEDDTAFDAAVASYREHPDTDGFYLSCPQWPVIGAIERLEDLTGKPVVTQLQAVMWWVTQRLGLDPAGSPVPLGRLLSTPGPLDALAGAR